MFPLITSLYSKTHTATNTKYYRALTSGGLITGVFIL